MIPSTTISSESENNKVLRRPLPVTPKEIPEIQKVLLLVPNGLKEYYSINKQCIQFLFGCTNSDSPLNILSRDVIKRIFMSLNLKIFDFYNINSHVLKLKCPLPILNWKIEFIKTTELDPKTTRRF